jgi:hypothetical protein
VSGEEKLFDLEIEPLYHTAWRDNSQGAASARQWVVVSDGNALHAYDMEGNLEVITPETPLGGGRINFTDLNGVLVINSLSSGPWYWPGPGDPDVRPVEPLPGWDPTWRCTYMIAHRYGLFALGMTEGVDYFPYKLRWSNSAQEGALPTSWDPTDLSKDAGDDILGETPGLIVGGARVRGQLYIIKEDAIYRARRVDGQYIYAIERLQGTIGTTAPKGWAEVQGALMVFTSTDVLVFDGQRQSSLSDGTVRESIFSRIRDVWWERSELFYHAPTEQLFVATVAEGDRLSDAHVLLTKGSAWGHRTLRQALGFDSAFIKGSATNPTWDELDGSGNLRWTTGGTWDEQTDGNWDRGVYRSSVPDIIVYESNGLLPTDPGVRYWVSAFIQSRNLYSDGRAKNCTARRVGLPINGARGLAMVTDVWFELAGDKPMQFRIGAQEVKDGTITWSPYYTSDPSTRVHLDPRLTGRFLAWELSSQADTRWELAALTIHWEPAGER